MMKTTLSTKRTLLVIAIVAPALACLGATSSAHAQGATVTSRTNGGSSIELRLRRVEQQLKAQALVELLREVRTLRHEVQSLRGENEVLQHKMEQMRRDLDRQVEQRIRELYVDIDKRLDRSATAVAGGSDGSNDDPSLDAKAAYEAAVNQLQAGDFAAAIAALNRFIEKHGQSSYAGSALYWLGEANYFEGHLEPAFTAYTKLITEQPDHSKVPDASLKVAYILDDQDKPEEAARALEAIIEHFAGTTVESQAQQRLDDIRNR